MSDNSSNQMSNKTGATEFSDDSVSVVSNARPAAPPPSASAGPDPDLIAEKLQGLVAGNSAPAVATSAESAAKDTASASSSSPSEQPATSEKVAEFSNWAPEVEDDVKQALERLYNLAIDEHAADESKGVQQYYSERMAKLLGGAPIAFDCKYLH